MNIGSLKSRLAICAVLAAVSSAAAAQPADGSPPAAGPEIKPIHEARARCENVEQAAGDGDALTIRIRAGAEAVHRPLALLVESEATIAPIAS